MQYGVVLPQGDAQAAVTLAREAEAAGWDGLFVWEPVWGADAWVCLTAAAMVTTRIRLGTMLSPLSRMRPWKLASESATLDRLSDGRVILSVGLGATDTGFAAFGEVTDRKMRAELLDEGLEILTGLWRGQPFEFTGRHYQVRPFEPLAPVPQPVQQPRIPIWAVGAWPYERSLQRVLRCDGLLPSYRAENGAMAQATPELLASMVAYVREHRPGGLAGFDVVVEGETPGSRPAEAARMTGAWAQVGATWWIEAMWQTPDLQQVLARVRQGPPR